MNDLHVDTIYADVTAFAKEVSSRGINGPEKMTYIEAIRGMYEALDRRDWLVVHDLLSKFAIGFIGDIGDRAHRLMGLIEKAKLLVPA